MDECTRHDSSSIMELVSRTLESVFRIATAKNIAMPTTLLLGSDNTVREAKNQYTMRYLINLVAKYHMRVTGLLNLRKSHTHDVLDQLWGILARRVATSDRFQSPESVIRILESELARPGLRGWVGLSTEISVVKMDGVRNWRDHFSCQQITLSGGLKDESTGNHCFIFTLYRGTCFHPKKIAMNGS